MADSGFLSLEEVSLYTVDLDPIWYKAAVLRGNLQIKSKLDPFSYLATVHQSQKPRSQQVLWYPTVAFLSPTPDFSREAIVGGSGVQIHPQ